MSGIKDLAILVHWMDNNKQSTLEASLLKKRKVPRERQLILNDLKNDAAPASGRQGEKSGARLPNEKMIR